MMTAVDLRDRGVDRATLGIVTPEPEPLRLFGEAAGAALREMLDARGITLWTDTRPVELRDGLLYVEPGPPLRADAVISVPALEGPALSGLPTDELGFIPVDAHGRVTGAPGVYAAGDATAVPGQAGRPRHPAGRRGRRGGRRRPRTSCPTPPPSGPCCADCCSPAARRCTCAPSWRAIGNRRRAGCTERSPGARCGGLPGRSPAATWRPTSAPRGPVDLGSEPLRDRTSARRRAAAADRDEAYRLALLLAEQDAEAGDYRQALHALDAAAALAGGVLPGRVGREPRALAARADAPGLTGT